MNKLKEKLFKIPFVKKYPKAALAITLAVAVATTGGVYSFLAATDQKDNMFTMGNLSVSLYEDDWYDHETGAVLDDADDGTGIGDNGIPNFAELAVCGTKIHKHPYVENTGDNAAWIFMSVGIPTVDVADAVATEAQINSLVGSEYTVKVTGYAFQEGLENMTQEEMWDTFSNGVPALKNRRTNNTRVGIFEITDVDETNWEFIEQFNSTDNYNYLVYAYKELLPGKEQDGIIVDLENNIYPYRTTPMFENIRMTGFSTSVYQCREASTIPVNSGQYNVPSGGQVYRYINDINDAPTYLAYDMVDGVPVYRDIVLSEGATLHINRNSGGIITAYIRFADGNYIRTTTDTNFSIHNASGASTKVSGLMQASKEYKISEIISGSNTANMCPHLELVCLENRYYRATMRLTFNVIGVNGHEYSFSAGGGNFNSNAVFYSPGEGTEGQAKWINACISTGMLIGNFAFVPGY